VEQIRLPRWQHSNIVSLEAAFHDAIVASEALQLASQQRAHLRVSRQFLSLEIDTFSVERSANLEENFQSELRI
jgi:hypothetical protein